MFDGCGALREISLPRAVRSIGDYAFYGCERLQELRLPEGREKHRAVCLYNCRRMEKINIPLAARELNTGLFLVRQRKAPFLWALQTYFRFDFGTEP